MPNSEICWLSANVLHGLSLGVHTVGGTLEWQCEDGTPVLFPQQEVEIGGETKLRGGMPLCFPVHGEQPREIHGCELPQHGLIRNMRPTRYAADGVCHFRHPGDERYLWPFTCKVDVVDRTSRGFVHRVLVRRSEVLGANLHPMPLDGGLHPYIATFGEDFEMWGDGWFLSKDTIVPGESRTIPLNGSLVSVKTRIGLIRLCPVFPYTHVVVWTDNPDLYVCVEPVTDRGAFGNPESGMFLNPGGFQAFTCMFSIDQ